MVQKNKCNYYSLKKPDFLAGAILFLLVMAVFSPVIHHGFINYDDHIYITQNDMVIKGLTIEGIFWAFTNISAGFWFPLTWISHMADCQIFGLNPGGHHFTSIVIHSANTTLLFLIMRKFSRSLFIGLFVAGIFAFHPLNVEPVAWASSRKDVLSTLFWFLTIWVYLIYSNRRTVKNYIVLLFFYILGLMTKPMIVTLPLILILIDLFPLYLLQHKEISTSKYSTMSYKNHIFLEKIPFLMLSVILVLLTYLAEKNYGALIPVSELPVHTRILNIFINYSQYLKMFFFPAGLSFHYPPQFELSLMKEIFSILLFVMITLISIKTRRRYPYIIFGWVWFAVIFIPVIGLVKIGSHSIADRYCYVPAIGLSIIISGGLYSLLPGLKDLKKAILMVGIILIPLITLSSFQLSYWKNDMTLFGHAVKVNDNNLVAHNNLAFAMANNGYAKDAIKHYRKALGLEKLRHEVYFNIGMAFQSLKKYEEAIYNYKASLSVNPDYLNAALNLGAVFLLQQKYDEASECFNNVLRINPNQAGAHNNLGIIMIRQNNLAGAKYHFNEALRIDPKNTKAIKSLKQLKKGS